ncbi:MAG TPA: hypothetical protein GX738_06020 [Firmicutes bacterium]|nr:hypothetical protein [Bacillota bacterium]
MRRHRLRSHLGAIVVTLIVIIGLPRLPAVVGLGLPSWFSLAWLLFAVLVLLAHVQRAQLFGQRKPMELEQGDRRRSRSET